MVSAKLVLDFIGEWPSFWWCAILTIDLHLTVNNVVILSTFVSCPLRFNRIHFSLRHLWIEQGKSRNIGRLLLKEWTRAEGIRNWWWPCSTWPGSSDTVIKKKKIFIHFTITVKWTRVEKSCSKIFKLIVNSYFDV